MIFIGEKKAVICKGDFHPAALYKGDKKITGYSLEEFTGADIVTLENCYNDKVYDVSLHGINLLDVESAWAEYANSEGGISYTNTDFVYIGRSGAIKISWKENTQYIISFGYEIESKEGNRVIIVISYTDNTKEYIYTNYTKGQFSRTTKADNTVSSIQVWYNYYDVETTVKLTNMRIEEYTEVSSIPITIRGKNYFDLDKVPFSNETTQPYNNGIKAKKTSGANRGNKIPISLPIGKTMYVSMDVVDSQISGSTKRVTMGFYNGENTLVRQINVTPTIEKKSYSFTLSESVSYIQFYFQSNNSSNAVGDYVTMDNIMLRTEGNDTFELYIEPQTIPFENGEPTKDIPTFKGTTVIEADGTITGTYKKQEV